MVTQGRSQVKRYGIIFTCLPMTAVHIEIAASLDTSSYINALRRFIARRGQVTTIVSDNGSNLHGADRQLKSAIEAWNQQKISESLLQRNVNWKFNVPAASDHRGV